MTEKSCSSPPVPLSSDPNRIMQLGIHIRDTGHPRISLTSTPRRTTQVSVNVQYAVAYAPRGDDSGVLRYSQGTKTINFPAGSSPSVNFLENLATDVDWVYASAIISYDSSTHIEPFDTFILYQTCDRFGNNEYGGSSTKDYPEQTPENLEDARDRNPNEKLPDAADEVDETEETDGEVEENKDAEPEDVSAGGIITVRYTPAPIPGLLVSDAIHMDSKEVGKDGRRTFFFVDILGKNSGSVEIDASNHLDQTVEIYRKRRDKFGLTSESCRIDVMVKEGPVEATLTGLEVCSPVQRDEGDAVGVFQPRMRYNPFIETERCV